MYLFPNIVVHKSHPAGVRGLKPCVRDHGLVGIGSHPAGVRGLKQIAFHSLPLFLGSHPAGVRGLKLITETLKSVAVPVAPRRGAWIETLASV